MRQKTQQNTGLEGPATGIEDAKADNDRSTNQESPKTKTDAKY